MRSSFPATIRRLRSVPLDHRQLSYKALSARVIPEIEANSAKLTEWRRDFHKHPEIAFEEFRTSKLVAERLTAMDIEVTTGIAGTGVVGTLKGKGEGSSKSIGLRADMDALPMDELNEFEHRSTVEGKMHGCGHDGHTTMLLGAAEYLASTQDFDGTVHFIFQPAEESLFGAKAMVEAGLFERFPCDQVFGMHNWPSLPAGTAALRSGPFLAGADFVDIVVHGVGGHAAMPSSVVDPVVVGAQIVGALQTVVSRALDPVEAAVLSITQFEAGSAYNVIPDSARLRGCIRTFTPEARELVIARVQQISSSVAAAHGAKATVEVSGGLPALVNEPGAADQIAAVASEVFGEANVLREDKIKPLVTSEDFGYMLQARPGCYIGLGQGGTVNGHDHSVMVHNPHYDFNDQVLPYGATVFAKLVEDALPIV